MLVKSIHIKNFRCFRDTKAKNFGHVNLFGGKNNSGKTALLEALLLANQPSIQIILTLLRFRLIDFDYMKKMPERAWDSFFFNGQKDLEISFFIERLDSDFSVLINRNESVEDFIDLIQSDSEENDENGDLINFAQRLNKKDAVKSVLNIKLNDIIIVSLVASQNAVLRKGIPSPSNQVFFIPAGLKLANESLATEFDSAKFNGIEDNLLRAFRLIDDSIEKVDTFQRGSSAIYLKRVHQDFMPLTLFGDAMNKIADIILRIINNEHSIVLIDEIENGIHHTNHRSVWKLLFELSLEFKVQIFATTHSKEMLEAFKDVVGGKGYHKEARYFELARHRVTNEIIVQKLSIDVLEEKLVTNKPVRGE